MIGKIYKALRDKRGVSQRDIEQNSGFSRSTLSQIENEKRNPTWNKIVEYAEALDFEVDEEKLLEAFVDKRHTQEKFEQFKDEKQITDNDIFL